MIFYSCFTCVPAGMAFHRNPRPEPMAKGQPSLGDTYSFFHMFLQAWPSTATPPTTPTCSRTPTTRMPTPMWCVPTCVMCVLCVLVPFFIVCGWVP